MAFTGPAAGRQSIDDTDDSASSSSSDAPLPFPSALPREDFLTPIFDPVSYLSSLPSRHQTLEDLRAELRDRSAAISAELVELVNNNYTAFLSLGSELRGGADRVEDVRVALLAYRRQVNDVRAKVDTMRGDVATATSEMALLREEIERAREMLDLEERVAVLEEDLALGEHKGGEEDWFCNESDDDDTEGGMSMTVGTGGGFASSAKLISLARDCKKIESLADDLGRDLAFVVKMEERMARCRNTILLDLETALKAVRKTNSAGQIMSYLAVYSLLGAQADAVRALKS